MKSFTTLNNDELAALMKAIRLNVIYRLTIINSESSSCTIDGLYFSQQKKRCFITLNIKVNLTDEIEAALSLNTIKVIGILAPTEHPGQKIMVAHRLEHLHIARKERFVKPKLNATFKRHDDNTMLTPLGIYDISVNGIGILINPDLYSLYALCNHCIIEFEDITMEIACELVNKRDENE
ncbi:MAG: hypothetical protein LBH05_03205, partial [Deferribacteraceae bacterium]|nr:hypothetical protein [Deferribacteraceae bacterium]